jgi:uncharacterized protein YvpB
MNKTLKIIIWIIIGLGFLGGGAYYYKWAENHGKFPFKPAKVQTADFSVNVSPIIESVPSENTPSGTTLETNLAIPASVQISVPFTTQAPFANWDPLHEEACEEASLIMVKHFLDKTNINSEEQAEEEIKALVAWETEHGYKEDVTLEEIAEIAEAYYGLKNSTITTGITINDIKMALVAGKPVIIPAAGRILPNPNFRNGGPNYHMLVVTGYDEEGFITNDPGTRKGYNFRYTYEGLYNAIHDFTEGDMLKGPKRMLIFTK